MKNFIVLVLCLVMFCVGCKAKEEATYQGKTASEWGDQLLKDKDPKLQEAALLALGKIGIKAVPVLAKALKHEDRYVRRAAATTLGKIGAEAKAAVPAVLEALKDEMWGDSRLPPKP